MRRRDITSFNRFWEILAEDRVEADARRLLAAMNNLPCIRPNDRALIQALEQLVERLRPRAPNKDK